MTKNIPIIGTKKGFFLVMEGADAVGKDTQIALLDQALKHFGFSTDLIREPGGTKLGESIRDMVKNSSTNICPEAELLLMSAARSQLVRERIRPSLAAGNVVLCNRFYPSSICYQGFGRGLNQIFIKAAIQFSIEDVLPDLTFVLYLTPKEAEARRKIRGTKDRFEQDPGFVKRVEEGYDWLKDQEKNSDRIISIDANNSQENVHNEIFRCVVARIGKLKEGSLTVDPGKQLITR